MVAGAAARGHLGLVQPRNRIVHFGASGKLQEPHNVTPLAANDDIGSKRTGTAVVAGKVLEILPRGVVRNILNADPVVASARWTTASVTASVASDGSARGASSRGRSAVRISTAFISTFISTSIAATSTAASSSGRFHADSASAEAGSIELANGVVGVSGVVEDQECESLLDGDVIGFEVSEQVLDLRLSSVSGKIPNVDSLGRH